MTVRLLIVEDENLMRVTLDAALGQHSDFDVRSAASAADALEQARTWRPQCALLDIHLGRGPNGADVARALRRDNPGIGIVFLTSLGDPRLFAGAESLPSGSQYLQKRFVSDVSELVDTIHASLDGASRRAPVGIPRAVEALNRAQLETLSLVAQGLSNAQIAEQRNVSIKAVENMVARIARRLEVPPSTSTNQRVLLARKYFELVGIAVERA